MLPACFLKLKINVTTVWEEIKAIIKELNTELVA